MDKMVSAIMQKSLITVNVDDPVEKVERLLRTHRLTCVPVLDDDGHCYGLINASHLIEFHMTRKNAMALKAWEVCLNKVLSVNFNMRVRDAAELMIRKQVHHLLVVDAGQVHGLVTSLDLVRELLSTLDPTFQGATDAKGLYAGLI